MEKISIVMPCYNGIKYIKIAIDSLLSQTHQDWVLWVSDDGSNDGTRDYLRSLNDRRINVFFQEKNLGIFGNLNFLFSQKLDDITQIFCQDDSFTDPQSLEKIIATWQTLSPDIAFLRSNHNAYSKSSLVHLEQNRLPPIIEPKYSNLLFFIFGCIPGNLSNVSLRSNIVKAHGWFRVDLPYAGDFEFWSRVGAVSRWAISKQNVVMVRSHQEQASTTLNKKGELLQQLRVIIEHLYQACVQQGYSPFWLKMMATANYISYHRDMGLKAWLKSGTSTYLQKVMNTLDTALFSTGRWSAWLVFCLTLGGRVFRVSIAKQLMPRSMK